MTVKLLFFFVFSFAMNLVKGGKCYKYPIADIHKCSEADTLSNKSPGFQINILLNKQEEITFQKTNQYSLRNILT